MLPHFKCRQEIQVKEGIQALHCNMDGWFITFMAWMVHNIHMKNTALSRELSVNQFPLKFLYVVFKISLNQKFDQKSGPLIHD